MRWAVGSLLVLSLTSGCALHRCRTVTVPMTFQPAVAPNDPAGPTTGTATYTTCRHP